MIRIATWNVNSIKARLPLVLAWLERAAPDVVLLQETKVVDAQFPALEINGAGYVCATVGQKTYNGVAILSKFPVEIVLTALPGDPADEQARYVEAVTGGVRVASVYAPNGNPTDSEKYPYKLAWLARLRERAAAMLEGEDAFVIGGDYNIAPEDGDVHDPARWKDDALCLPASRAAWRRLLNLGLTDAFRATTPEIGRYSWWDYQAGAWQRDQGLRIDHLLLSPQAADRLADAGIDRSPRGLERPSDHTPVWCALET